MNPALKLKSCPTSFVPNELEVERHQKKTSSWNWIMKNDHLEKLSSTSPLLGLVVTLIRELGLPVVFCVFFGYIFLMMLDKNEKVTEQFIEINQKTITALNENSKAFDGLRDFIITRQK